MKITRWFLEIYNCDGKIDVTELEIEITDPKIIEAIDNCDIDINEIISENYCDFQTSSQETWFLLDNKPEFNMLNKIKLTEKELELKKEE